MTDLQITCDNCGAKYKLPPTFTGAQAKCQKCGSVIDVARQRAAAAGSAAGTASKPAAPRPAAAAKPAVDRSKEASKPAARESAKATERPGRRNREGSADEGEPKRGRERKKDSSMPILLAGVGLLVLIAGGAFLLKGGDKPADAAQAAKKDGATPTPDAPRPEAAKPDAAAKPEAAQPPDAKAAPAAPAAKEGEPSAKPETAKPPEGQAPATTPDESSRTKRPWEKQANPPQSMDQVVDPKSFGEVTWPASIDAKVKADVQALVEDVAGGGKPGIRAKPKLVELGYPALFGLVEKLRLLDYKSTEDSQLAFEMNKMLEDLTSGANAGFEPVEATETLVPAKAEWNGKSVRSWLNFLAKYPDEASFKAFKKERAAKQDK